MIESMETCPQSWCCYAYPIFRTKVRLRVGLGCVKISRGCAARISTDPDRGRVRELRGVPGKGCWWHLDGRIAGLLKRAGFWPHVHGGVRHHHDYEAGMVEGARAPVEWFFEEGADTSSALVINPDVVPPFEFSLSPRTRSPRRTTCCASRNSSKRTRRC